MRLRRFDFSLTRFIIALASGCTCLLKITGCDLCLCTDYFKGGHRLYLNTGWSSSLSKGNRRLLSQEATLVTAHGQSVSPHKYFSPRLTNSIDSHGSFSSSKSGSFISSISSSTVCPEDSKPLYTFSYLWQTVRVGWDC